MADLAPDIRLIDLGTLDAAVIVRQDGQLQVLMPEFQGCAPASVTTVMRILTALLTEDILVRIDKQLDADLLSGRSSLPGATLQ